MIKVVAVIARLTNQTSSLLAVLSATAIGLIALAASANVITRALTDRPLPGVIDLGSLLVVAAVFAAVAQAERTEAHVRMRLVTDRIRPRVANAMRAGAMALSSLIVGVMVYGTGVRAYHSYLSGETQVSVLRWPVWPTRFVVTAGLALLFVVLIIKTIIFIRRTLENQSEQPGNCAGDADL